MLLWKHLHQLLLHLLRIFSLRPAQSAGNTENVCVHCHPRNPIGISQKQSGCLSSDSCKLQHLIQLIRHLSAIFTDDLLTAFFDIFSFILIQTYRTDILLDFFRRRLRYSLRGLKMPEQFRQRLIHLLIRTLGTEHNSCQQLPVMVMVKALLRCSICLIQHI